MNAVMGSAVETKRIGDLLILTPTEDSLGDGYLEAMAEDIREVVRATDAKDIVLELHALLPAHLPRLAVELSRAVRSLGRSVAICLV